MTRSTPMLAAMYLLVYHGRALVLADLTAWAGFTFVDYWPGQVLALAAFVGLVAFQFGVRLGEATE